MLKLSDWYQLNSPGVVCDVVDDEVVIVSLDSGAYYSTEKAGATLWHHLSAGQTVEGIVQSMTAHYAGPQEEIEKSVTDLISELVAEELIVPGDGASTPAPNSVSTIAEPAEKVPFEGIALQKFFDMEDLLLLDPVHEVADAGWPNQRN